MSFAVICCQLQLIGPPVKDRDIIPKEEEGHGVSREDTPGTNTAQPGRGQAGRLIAQPHNTDGNPVARRQRLAGALLLHGNRGLAGQDVAKQPRVGETDMARDPGR